MPEKETLRRARRDKAAGKPASTQAGEFIREEMHHVREGKHGARSRKQVIAIGLSKARRAGVKLAPRGGSTKKTAPGGNTRIHAVRANPKRSRAAKRALNKSGRPRLRGPEARASARKAASTRARRKS